MLGNRKTVLSDEMIEDIANGNKGSLGLVVFKMHLHKCFWQLRGC